MKRLDSGFATSSNKLMICGFLVFMWFLAIQSLTTDNLTQKEKGRPFLYILPPLTLVALWWLSSFKKVSLDKDTLVIQGFRKEARIPLLQIEKTFEHRLNKGLAYITIKFKSKTAFGRRIRVMIGTSGRDFDKVVKLLRAGMEGKDLAVKINHVAFETAKTYHQKEIIVSGWTKEELSTILGEFADMYGDDLNTQFDYEVSPCNASSFQITFPHDISGKIFSFLVNYLNYPKNFDAKGRSISVVGYAVLSTGFHPPSKALIDQKAAFYVPADDSDYDLVYVRIGDETFEISFAAMHWKKVSDPRIPNGVKI